MQSQMAHTISHVQGDEEHNWIIALRARPQPLGTTVDGPAPGRESPGG